MTDQGGSIAMGLDAFLNHDTRGGGDGQFLRWRNRQPPLADIWLHTRAPIIALWQHSLPRIVDREDKNTGVKSRQVWGGSWNCWEAEATLKRQYFRDKQTGHRKTPPQVCPFCILTELIRFLVDSGRLSWVAPIFRFVGDDPAEAQVLHAGGLYNAYGKDDLGQAELDELKQARIFRTESWKENTTAKCNYVFAVVDNDEPSSGVQVSTETSLLGDRTKEEIAKRMRSKGREAGNPHQHPYCLRWEHLPKEPQFDKRYRVTAMEQIVISEDVRRLIVDDAPPDTSRLVRVGSVSHLRGVMEAHYCGPQGMLDWDSIFAKAEAQEKERADTDPDDDASFDFGANATQGAGAPRSPQVAAGSPGPVPVGMAPAAAQGQASPLAQAVQSVTAPRPEADEEEYECDDCSSPMKASDASCPNCGKVYVVEQPEPPPPARRKRSGAAGQQALGPTGSMPAQPHQPANPRCGPSPAGSAQPQPAQQGDGNEGWEFPPAGADDIPF